MANPPLEDWVIDAERLTKERDALRAEVERLRAGIERLGNEITPEMQHMADHGWFRALWINLRTDIRALATPATEETT